MRPLVTVGIAFYNAETHILETLNSIHAQTHAPIELILYDDASEDDSSRIVSQWLVDNGSRFERIEYLSGEINKGPSYGASCILQSAKGSYFQLVGADDLLYPTKLSDQVNLLEGSMEYGMVFSNAHRIDEAGVYLDEDYYHHQQFKHVINGIAPHGSLYEKLLEENFIPSCAWIARTNVLRDAGGYNPHVYIEDWDLWLRVAQSAKLLFSTDITSAYRIRSSSIMHSNANKKKAFASHLATLSAHLGNSQHIDQLLAPHINRYSIGLYRAGGYPTRYLFKNVCMNFSLKSFTYLLLSLFRLRISLS
ncbi:MAG: glycosyltransferase family 2 protein [Chitinophagaceae bacterium]|jgi:glycosyltransferase involved in cell wall biosynthesis